LIAPWHLAALGLANTVRLSLPCNAVTSVSSRSSLAWLSNDWGPGGSVGYELASRATCHHTRKVTLTLVISAPDRFDRDFRSTFVEEDRSSAPAKVGRCELRQHLGVGSLWRNMFAETLKNSSFVLQQGPRLAN